jgi:hypothetical protein
MQRLGSFGFMLAGLLIGCGGDKAMTSAPDMALVGKLCTPADPRADAWKLPLAKASAMGSFNVTLLKSQENIPLIGDTTTWTLQIADPSGAMISNADVSVLPWMPDHHHGTSVKAAAKAMATAGQYQVTPLYLFMAGYWTITFTITTPAATDTVVFSLCLTDA